MTEQDERTPGTTVEPKPDDAAPSVVASGDTAADGSESEEASREDRIAELERKNAQLLSEKSSFEEAQREIERLRRASAAPHPPATGDEARSRELYQNDLRLEDELIAGVDPTVEHLRASARLSRYRTFQATAAAQKTEQKVEVVTLPEDIRDEAQKLANEEGVSVRFAARLLKAERAANGKAENHDTDEERIARLRAKRDSTPSTTSRPLGSGESGKTITRAEYNRQLAKFDDADDIRGKAELVKRKNEGKLRVSG